MRLYLGDICGVGLSPDGYPVGIFAVTENDAERQRIKAVPYENRIAIEPDSEAGLPAYDAIMISNDSILVCSNGEQTNTIFERIMRSKGVDGACITGHASDVLNELGPVSDKYKTPRIFAATDTLGYNLGIIDKSGIFVSRWFDLRQIEPGFVKTVRTYEGDIQKPQAPADPFNSPLQSLQLRGNDPQEIAESLFDDLEDIGHGLTVATAAAVLNRGWELASKNRNRYI